MPYYRILFIFTLIILTQYIFAQDHNLLFYQTAAAENNPTIKENIALKQYNRLQNDLTLIPLRKPQVNITGDLLFAPYFFNNGHFISITPNPETKAYGYDVGLSNGGLYAAQINASLPLFTDKLIGIYGKQAIIQNQVLDNNNQRLRHELEKIIADQYVDAYQWQEQINYEEKIMSMVENRKEIIEALVQKGLMEQNEFLLLDIEIKQRQYDIQQMKIFLSAAFQQLNTTCAIVDTTIYILSAPELSPGAPLPNYNYKIQFELDSAKIKAEENIFNLKYRPQLTAFGDGGLNSSNAAHIPHDIGFSAGLHLEIPLYDGNQRKTVAQQNRILMDNLYLYQNQNRTLIKNKLASLNQQIALTQKSIPMINSKLASQESLLQIIRDKVITGQISVTDYLNALQDYAISRQNMIKAQTSLWLLINQYNYENW